jgi:hypothetical protein
METTDRGRTKVVRDRAGARRGLCVMAAAALFLASPAFAEQGANQGASPQGETQAPNAFYARVASFLGMEPNLIEGLVPEFRREGVKTNDAVLLLLFADKRTQRLLREETITKEEMGKTFRDSISGFLEKRRAQPDWRGAISQELGVDLHDMTKQATNTVREAMRPTAGADSSARAIRAATPREVPEELVQPLLQRLRVQPQVLKQAWGALESITGGSPRPAILLLVLAREKTDRLLQFGAVASEEKDKVFLDSLADFINEVGSHPGIGWGSLASQVGLHSQDLQMEALSIFKSAGMRKAERERLSGARVEAPVVPPELSE